MKQLIHDGKDLEDYFFSIRNNERAIEKGVYVSNKVRQEVLLGLEQGRITINGKVKRFEFNTAGGGVWHTTIVGLNRL